MNKKGFFIEWGKDSKQEYIGIQTENKCHCKGNQFYLIYNFQRSHIFWFIPVSDWEIVEVFNQCANCGLVWKLDGEEEELAIKLHEEAKKK